MRASLSTAEFAFLADRLRSGVNIQESVGPWEGLADLADSFPDAIKKILELSFMH